MSAQSAAGDARVKVTQVRSGIGTKPKHRATLRALGLRGIGRSRVLPDSASVRGMISKVSHLVEISQAELDVLAEPEAARASASTKAAPAVKKAAASSKAAPRTAKAAASSKAAPPAKTAAEPAAEPAAAEPAAEAATEEETEEEAT